MCKERVNKQMRERTNTLQESERKRESSSRWSRYEGNGSASSRDRCKESGEAVSR